MKQCFKQWAHPLCAEIICQIKTIAFLTLCRIGEMQDLAPVTAESINLQTFP